MGQKPIVKAFFVAKLHSWPEVRGLSHLLIEEEIQDAGAVSKLDVHFFGREVQFSPAAAKFVRSLTSCDLC